jgi:hypothetical protein
MAPGRSTKSMSMIMWIRTSRLSIIDFLSQRQVAAFRPLCDCLRVRETELFNANLLVRIHLIIKMILVDRPCAMRVGILFS